MKNCIIILGLIFLVQLVVAQEVCVVVDYGNDIDSECVDIEEGADGKAVLDQTGLVLEWADESIYGSMLCRINGVGTDVDGTTCEYSGEFWNFVLQDGAEWGHSPIGLNGGEECWNRDFSFSDWGRIVHYCAEDGDLIGFSFGEAGREPVMLSIKNIKVNVDGKRESSADEDGGKIDVKPGSFVEMDIELENLYSRQTKIDLENVLASLKINDIDDGNDIEEDVEKDISAGNDKIFSIDFDVPVNVDDESYDLLLEVTGEDEFGIEYELERKFDIEVDREKHDVRLFESKILPEEPACRDTFAVYFTFFNAGEEDETVALSVYSDMLNIDLHENFELDNGAQIEKIFDFKVDDLKAGVYPIGLEGIYSGKRISSTLYLQRDSCSTVEGIVESVGVSEIEAVELVLASQRVVANGNPVHKDIIPLVVLISFIVALVVGIILLAVLTAKHH